MTYSDREMEEIERDPVRLRAYYWHMAQHWKRLSKKYRDESRQQGELHPVTNYRGVFDKGYEKEHWAKTLDASSDILLNNIDAFVETTLVQENG